MASVKIFGTRDLWSLIVNCITCSDIKPGIQVCTLIVLAITAATFIVFASLYGPMNLNCQYRDVSQQHLLERQPRLQILTSMPSMKNITMILQILSWPCVFKLQLKSSRILERPQCYARSNLNHHKQCIIQHLSNLVILV